MTAIAIERTTVSTPHEADGDALLVASARPALTLVRAARPAGLADIADAHAAERRTARRPVFHWG